MSGFSAEAGTVSLVPSSSWKQTWFGNLWPCPWKLRGAFMVYHSDGHRRLPVRPVASACPHIDLGWRCANTAVVITFALKRFPLRCVRALLDPDICSLTQPHGHRHVAK